MVECPFLPVAGRVAGGADTPEAAMKDTHAEWPEQIGEVVLTFVEQTAVGGAMERRVLFAGGLDVDFAAFPASVVAGVDLENPSIEIQNAVGRGVRVIVDRDGLLAGLDEMEVAPPEPSRPTADEYGRLVAHCLYHVLWSAKHLRRGEIWWARSGLEGGLNRMMLPMIEWHSAFCGDTPRDTWFRGRFLERWADPKVVARLRDATSRYDPGEVADALRASHALFRGLAVAVADRLGFEYPADADAEVERLTNEVLSGRS